ncbi:MAG TPA: O-antigen ligase family protein [Fibrobacteria bacterium]|nr:O-antigen ligase family protein [Fibrobacteria bacterium]
MRFLLVLLCTALFSAAALRAPVFGVCIFLWHDIFQPLTFAFRQGSIPLAAYCLAVMFGSFLHHLFNGKLKPAWTLFHLEVAIFLVWILICAIVSPYPTAWEGMRKVAVYLIPMGIIAFMVQTVRDMEWVSATLMFSVGIWAAAAGILGPFHGSYPYLAIEGGQMSDNNEVAAATVGYLPFCIHFIFHYSGRFRLPVRLAILGLFLVSLSSIAFSQSRGAAVATGTLAVFFLTLISKHKIRDTLVLVLFSAGALYFAPDSFWERMGTINIGVEQTEASASNRMALMKAAWEGTLDNPIFGMGPYCWLDGYAQYIDDRHNPHDVWLKCSVEIGLVGLGLFLAIISTVLACMWRVRQLAMKADDARGASMAMAVMASIIGVSIALSFLSQPYWEYFWAILAGGAGFHARYVKDDLLLKARARKHAAMGSAPRGAAAP